MRTKLRALIATWLVVATTAFALTANSTKAADPYYVDATRDYWISIPEQNLLHLWTDLCDNTTSGWCGGIVDSMLWLYDSNGTLIAANDDSYTDHTGGYSLASTIRILVPAGNYRIRAGVCCGDPTADRFYGNHYYLHSNFNAELAPGTPSATWTPTPEPTPTPTPTPTPEPTPTPTPDPYLNAPTGLMVTVYSNGNVYLTWNAPEASGTDVERYGVFWTTGELNGWGTPSTETNMGIANNVFVITGGTDQTYTFWVRADNDTFSIYSPISDAVSVFVPAPPLPTPSPTPSLTPEPTPTPTPEPTLEPTPTPTPETPSPSPSVAPTPTPEPSIEPTPTPTPELTPTPSPSPEVTYEPTPDPTATPEPTTEPTPTPTESPSPSPDPSPVPTDTPGPIDPGAAIGAVTEAVGEVAAAAAKAVGEAVTAVSEAVGAAVETVANLGKDISEKEKEEARTVVGPAVIMTTIAQAAVAAVARQNQNNSGNTGGGGGGAGGEDGKDKPRRGRSRGNRQSARIRNGRTNK